jgi:hypothetical protein
MVLEYLTTFKPSSWRFGLWFTGGFRGRGLAIWPAIPPKLRTDQTGGAKAIVGVGRLMIHVTMGL